MRWTECVSYKRIATCSCLILAPAYAGAEAHGGPTPGVQHGHVPQSTTTPTPTNAPTNPTKGSTVGTTPSTTHAPTTSATLNPIAQKITTHPQLAAKVQALLPTGTTLNQASANFRNQGQFIAALHASKNLGISFASLQADMTGTKHLSLGQAIQDLRPQTRSTTEARHAEAEADDDLKTTITPSKTANPSLNAVGRKISSNPQLSAEVNTLLPTGMTLSQASKGFRSEEQFLAALHASKNLTIPFAQLQMEMTGKDHDSLGAARLGAQRRLGGVPGGAALRRPRWSRRVRRAGARDRRTHG